jgi:suppressor of ftsI
MVIHAAPGSRITLDYQNRMSSHSKEVCVDGPWMNMTNLHFHRLHVSPDPPQDDVFSIHTVKVISSRWMGCRAQS